MLCQQTLSFDDIDHFKHAIDAEYHNNWIIDNLPAASILDSFLFIKTQYVGFPVGYSLTDTSVGSGNMRGEKHHTKGSGGINSKGTLSIYIRE